MEHDFGGNLPGIDADDSIWQIERATQTLTIHLEKEPGIAWPILIVGPGPAPADSIDAQSLHYLGEAFEHGRGYSLPADGAQALLHYVKSAEKDFLPALVRLARAYTPDAAPAALLSPGSGGVSYGNSLDAIERNAATARHYYTKAAELGSPEAQAQLAWALLHPAMLAGSWEADPAAARDWAEKSALSGCAEGCYVLGLCYEGDPATAKLAVDSFKKAGPAHAAAMHSLAWHQLRCGFLLSRNATYPRRHFVVCVVCAFTCARFLESSPRCQAAILARSSRPGPDVSLHRLTWQHLIS